MNTQGKQKDYSGIKVFMGLDAHKKSWTVATCTPHTNPSRWPVTIRAPFVENTKRYLQKNFTGAM